MGWSNTGRAYRMKRRMCKRKKVYLVLLRSLQVLSFPSLDGRSIAAGWIRVNDCSRWWGQVRVANLWSGRLDLESDWLPMRICNPEILFD